MPDYNFKLPRLYHVDDLKLNAPITLDKNQSNYVSNVMRLKAGGELLIFNGRDGEWLAQVMPSTGEGRRRAVTLNLVEQTRPQTLPAEFRYLFAPLKQARQDYMVQKAVEMGVSALVPVRTDHTQVARVNGDRIAANIVEACEQCGVLNLPDIEEYQPLRQVSDFRNPERPLIFCDERADTNNPLSILSDFKRGDPISVLIGPEGGFSKNERRDLAERPNTIAIPLGPRILRADTAAVAALTAIQMICGDWDRSS